MRISSIMYMYIGISLYIFLLSFSYLTCLLVVNPALLFVIICAIYSYLYTHDKCDYQFNMYVIIVAHSFGNIYIYISLVQYYTSADITV